MSDFCIPRPTPDAFETEHSLDPRDLADAFVLLDGGSVCLAVCEGCGQTICVCCSHCGTYPCRCEPISQREFRAMAARYDGAPERYRP